MIITKLAGLFTSWIDIERRGAVCVAERSTNAADAVRVDTRDARACICALA